MCLQRCGYFTSLCDFVETVDRTSDVGSADQLETSDVEVDEPSASTRGQERSRRAGRQAANRRRPRTSNWQGSRGSRAGSAGDVHDIGDQELHVQRRGGRGPAARRIQQYRGQTQRYRGQGRGMISGVGVDDGQQSHDDGGAYRGAAEGRRFTGQYRGGRYRRPDYQSISNDSGGVQQPAAYARGFRARGRGGFQSSGPNHGPSDDPEQLYGTSQHSRVRGLPYRGRGTLRPPYFHHSTESLDDAASTESDYGRNRRVVDIPNEVGDEKCQVLIYCVGELKQFGCRVMVNKKNHQVIVTGGSAEEALDKTVDLVYQKLLEMQPVKCTDISPGLGAVLSSRKGIKWVRELFKEHKKRAVFYTDNNSVYAIATDVTVAREAVALLSDQMGTVDVPFAESQATFLQSQGWQNFASSVEKNWTMTVEVVQSPLNVVRLVGVSSQLPDADSMVRSQLAEKSVSVAELDMSSGELRYLDAYRKDFR